jgi:thymidylate synthase
MVGSLHIYDADREKVGKFLKEDYQSRIMMPRMPVGDPWPNLTKLIKVEARSRNGLHVEIDRYRVPNYWADLMRLLQIFALNKQRRSPRAMKAKMKSDVYDAYINKYTRRSA